MKTSYLILFLLYVGSVLPAAAQPAQALIPTLESAESIFDTALQAFTDQQYDVAERLFGVVADNYDFHTKTTAALLMQGKSLYLRREYGPAIDVLSELVDTYPTSRYANEAARIIQFADQGANNEVIEAKTFRLGVALPLNSEAASFSQQLFNGIHVAVDNYNNRLESTGNPGDLPQVLMVFRDTNNDPRETRNAIRDLIEIEQVDAIVGPLFSAEALIAAEEVERAGVVMIAPLATAEEVATNRNYVFQANPTLEVRGKLMARFVVRGLGIESIGLITDYTNSESLGMARGFEEELRNLEQPLTYQHFVSNPSSWFRLGDELSRDTLLQADAVYLPINGGNASTLIGGALGSFDRMGMGSRIRVIGNVEWHSISNVSLASNYGATYSNDFYVTPEDSLGRAFQTQYTQLFSQTPQMLSYRGYDVTNFLVSQFDRIASTPDYPLHLILREAPFYRGAGIRIDFTNGNVNEAMFYHRYRDGVSTLLR